MKSSFIQFTIAFAVCVSALVTYGFLYAAVSAKSVVVANLESEIAMANEATSRAASMRAAMTKITSDEAAIQSYFVPEIGVVTFITDLEARGRLQSAAVNVLSVSAGGEAKQPTLVLTLTINGTFDSVMRTVGAIEYAPYALSISGLSLGQDGKDGWRANLKLRVGSLSANTATRPGSSDSLKATTP